MAEKSDIDDFFAKKASKSKKKSNVMNVGEIAQKLERSAIIHVSHLCSSYSPINCIHYLGKT